MLISFKLTRVKSHLILASALSFVNQTNPAHLW